MSAVDPKCSQFGTGVSLPILYLFALGAATVLALCGRAEETKPIRVALMDLATDENSYGSIEAAANFTGLVQVGLGSVPGVEWVERARIGLVKQEWALATLREVGGVSPLRRGQMAGADWLITGCFSLDDQNRRVLALQIVELQHADVLASETLKLPESGGTWMALDRGQVDSVVAGMRSLLGKARARQQQLAGQPRVALLFLADRSEGFRSHQGLDLPRRELFDRVANAAATNGRLQLVNFPKAYQATEEAEMEFDGIIDAGRGDWRQTADLYVWGTYWVTNQRVAGKFESKLEISLSMWDGAAQPAVFKDELSLSPRGTVRAGATGEALDRLVREVVARARPSAFEADSTATRRQIADSIVKIYLQMTGSGRAQLGLDDKERFVEAVHMLETACFFDPDNADARALWLTCRYGWWVDFGTNVKNQFWTMLRRSQAWQEFVERFEFSSTKVRLPFPYNVQGASAAYVDSLERVLKSFPQWHSAEEMALEDQYRKQGVHTWLVEAELHGFPKAVPHELALQWRTELEAELAARQKRVREFAEAQPKSTNNVALTNASARRLGPPGRAGLSNAPGAKSAGLTSGVTQAAQTASVPAWLKEIRPNFRMFQLSPPDLLGMEIKPDIQEVNLPARSSIDAVRQVGLYRGQILFLATEEFAAHSSERKPELSADFKRPESHLWAVPPGATNATRFEPDLIRDSVNFFLPRGDLLWLAGKATGYFEPGKRIFRKFGLRDGLTFEETDALALAGGHLFAAGDAFRISRLLSGSSNWAEVRRPNAPLSTGTGEPQLLAGNGGSVSYVAGSTLLYDLGAQSWTNVSGAGPVLCLLPQESGYWYGCADGLRLYEQNTHTLRTWSAPAALPGVWDLWNGIHYSGGSTISRKDLDRVEQLVVRSIRTLRKQREGVHSTNAIRNALSEPLNLAWRVPGGIAALADDGDFLWIGGGGHRGVLVLLHKPSLCVVGWCRVGEQISSLASSEKEVWIGTAYGKRPLLHLEKAFFLSVPRQNWESMAVTEVERQRAIRGMTLRDQAVYAFYSGDDQRVVELLGGFEPRKASLEDMFLLAFSYDASGVDQPHLARAWSGQISSRYPESPWSKVAQEALQESERLHEGRARAASLLARYDLNHDGVLDARETVAMEQDPVYQRDQKALDDKKLGEQIQEVMRRFDSDQNGWLDAQELETLRNQARLYAEVGPETLSKHKVPVGPLASAHFPTVPAILKKYDRNGDGGIDANELKNLAIDLSNGR